jgi:hypothetical protein
LSVIVSIESIVEWANPATNFDGEVKISGVASEQGVLVGAAVLLLPAYAEIPSGLNEYLTPEFAIILDGAGFSGDHALTIAAESLDWLVEGVRDSL